MGERKHRANGAGTDARPRTGPTTSGMAPVDREGFPFPPLGALSSSQNDRRQNSLDGVEASIRRRGVTPEPHLPSQPTMASTSRNFDHFGSEPNSTTPASSPRPETDSLSYLPPSPAHTLIPSTPSSVSQDDSYGSSFCPSPDSTVAADDNNSNATSSHTNNLSRHDYHPRPPKFRAPVFTRSFTTFDRQNPHAANSPFYGFFTLFWMAVFLFVVKLGASNWRAHGNVLGTNEILTKVMFGSWSEVGVLAASDGVMCGLTGFGWVVQRMVVKGERSGGWESWGWVVQNIWQMAFIGGVVGFTRLREWPWTHTVFFVLHGLVMLMKQHSYAFYNGHLSTVYKQRKWLLGRLKELEKVSPVASPSTTEPPVANISTIHLAKTPSAKERRLSLPHENLLDVEKIVTAIDSREPLDQEQIHVFERVLKWEVDALSDELRGKSTKPGREYPHNLTLANHYEYLFLPTVVYELEYPRSKSINWYYAAEKFAACFGIILVMNLISQTSIYPVVMETVRMKEEGMPLADRFREFPWMLLDLIFPFMMEYLLTWYLIWETVLNLVAELTNFADRGFYNAWWNCVSWDQFARDWNRPVHNFLLRHVYHSSISAMKVNKHTATLITFFLSALVHELVMWCIFKKLRGYLLFLQMCQLPLVRLSQTKWLRNRATLGNMMFWFGILTGPSVLCSLYLIL